MSTIIEQAAIAAQQGNWSLLHHCLQGLYDQKNTTESQSLDESDRTHLLNLALQAIETGDFQERWEAAKLFGTIGQEAIAPLIELLQNEEADPEARWFAGRILGQFNDPIVVISLVKLLTSAEDEDLAEMAAQALVNIGSSAINALSDLLIKEDSRALTVQALAHIRHPETIPSLLSVVKDPSPAIRTSAIEALSSFYDSRIPPILIDALKDTSAAVRKEAVIGLGLRAHQLKDFDLVNILKPLLYDFNLDVCQEAAIALGRLGSDAAADALFHVLKSPVTPSPLTIEIVRALSWFGSPKAIEYLHEGLYSASESICQEIVSVLGRVESLRLKSRATQILIDFLNSDYSTAQKTPIKQAIALSLGQLGQPQAIDSLIKLSTNSEEGVQLHAMAALKKFS